MLGRMKTRPHRFFPVFNPVLPEKKTPTAIPQPRKKRKGAWKQAGPETITGAAVTRISYSVIFTVFQRLCA